MRNFLRRSRKRRANLPVPSASMLFLNADGLNDDCNALRTSMIRVRLRCSAPCAPGSESVRARAKQISPPSTAGEPPVRKHVCPFHQQTDARGSARGKLPRPARIEDPRMVPIIRDPKKRAKTRKRYSYFPGRGSERLFGQVGLATQAMLYQLGVHTVSPPATCVAGIHKLLRARSYKGQAIVTGTECCSPLARTLAYLDIKTVIVLCGTCKDQLEGYEFDKIFPGCRLLDIHDIPA